MLKTVELIPNFQALSTEALSRLWENNQQTKRLNKLQHDPVLVKQKEPQTNLREAYGVKTCLTSWRVWLAAQIELRIERQTHYIVLIKITRNAELYQLKVINHCQAWTYYIKVKIIV